MKSIQITVAFLLLNFFNTLKAQTYPATWETVKENLFTLSFPKSDWVRRIDSMTGASLMLATQKTKNRPYDHDEIRLRILENNDLLYGDLAAYEAQYKDISGSQILSANRIKKGKLEYFEKVENNHYGRIRRRIKEHRYFVNQKVYELTFDAEEKAYDNLSSQIDSIFNSFIITDFAVTVATKWVVFEKQNYTISYPTNWNLDEILPQHVDFMVKKPKRSDDKGYWDNLYLMINTFKESTPELGNYAQRATEQLKTTLKNSIIHQSKRKKSSSFSYQEVISEGDLGKHRVKMQQWHFVKGKKAYTFTYSARVESFDDMKDTIEKIFESLTLK